jgi:hypothetical protein
MGICILIIQAIWHATISFIIFVNTPNNAVHPSMWFITVDRCVFYSAVSTFIIVHIGLIIWLYLVPFGHQKRMAEKDNEYMLRMSELAKRKFSPTIGQNIGKISALPVY